MPTAKDVVLSFLEQINGKKDGFSVAVKRWFTPETVFHIPGVEAVVGPDAAIALMDNLVASTGASIVKIENVAVAADGQIVLTERLDTLFDEDGNAMGEIALAGVFEVSAEGKIIRWTEYFDPSSH
ncbi:MAG TPA: limonene-1,2-epoxide hydrolase family protein [Sphingobium sp.]|nr:limonene-1,2-epoxide hydrolase family protein [Sphingobium sp.]